MVHSPSAPFPFALSRSSAMDMVRSVLGPMTVGSSAVGSWVYGMAFRNENPSWFVGRVRPRLSNSYRLSRRPRVSPSMSLPSVSRFHSWGSLK